MKRINNEREDDIFERATPESVGIRSEIIARGIKKLNNRLVPMHSLLIMRHGRLITEAYWEPWNRESLHRIYSCTKSFVSMAIGVLVTEGKLSLDDSICDYFPEYINEKTDEKLKRCTIRDMLMMASPHRRTAYKEGSNNWSYIPSFQNDWVKPFFTVPSDHNPGALFIYDTSATQTLGALVEKLTKQPLLDFLRSTFLKDSGFSKEAYIVKEPGGYSATGSGLICRPLDMLIALKCVYDGGNGTISKEYLKAATSLQISNKIGSRGGLLDTSSGYGYQIWMNSHGWMFYGMGSQLAIAVPNKDILVVVTSDTQGLGDGEALIFDTIWDIVDSAEERVLDSNKEKFDELNAICSTLEVRHASGDDIKTLFCISGNEYIFEENNTIGIKSLRLLLNKTDGLLTLNVNGEEFSYPFGVNHNERVNLPFMEYGDVLSSGALEEDGTLGIIVQYIADELGTQIIQLAFKEDGVTLFMKQAGELTFHGFSGVASGVKKN